jgi:hypothetical protein
MKLRAAGKAREWEPTHRRRHSRQIAVMALPGLLQAGRKGRPRNPDGLLVLCDRKHCAYKGGKRYGHDGRYRRYGSYGWYGAPRLRWQLWVAVSQRCSHGRSLLVEPLYECFGYY